MAIVQGHVEFTARLRAEGVFVYGDALGEPEAARVLRADGMVTDGPFSAGREQLGGLYVIDCADRDAALGYARAVPASPGLSVEVRPVPNY